MDEKIAFYFTEDGEYAPKEGLPFKKRHNVAAIIKYEKQYLFLTWLETNYSYSLVTGGIEEGEEKETAIRREVIEETGYTIGDQFSIFMWNILCGTQKRK